MKKQILAVLALATTTAALAEAGDPARDLDGFARFVAADGSFHFDPSAATEDMLHLGSWFVPAGEAAGFHHVYAQSEAVEAYRATGEFPDGTALVKEIVRVRRGDYTTGADVASFAETAQWFVMVKDATRRFPDHPLWGEGWGWALFRSDEPTRNVAGDFRADCQGCHAPARESDWVYVEGYPVLRPE